MVYTVLKSIGILAGLFLIGSSNYILTNIVLGKTADIPSGVILYLSAGVAYIVGLLIFGALYILSARRRDILLGLGLIGAGLIHYYPIYSIATLNIDILFVWGLQFTLSIVMSIIFFYLGYRKLRKRIVEIPIDVSIGY